MRIQLLWSFYDHYLAAFYAAWPGLGQRTYAEQLEALLDDGFGCRRRSVAASPNSVTPST